MKMDNGSLVLGKSAEGALGKNGEAEGRRRENWIKKRPE
jgi:hypothetical protein